MDKKNLFKKFSEDHKATLPYCLSYDWWNEVVVNDWDVLILSNESQVTAVWPYYIRKKGPWKLLTNPHFTPYCGPFLNYPEGQKKAKRISFEHNTHQQLIDLLPSFSEFSQNINLACSNTLAFLWNGFEDSKRYTYVLNLKDSEAVLWDNLRENTRRQIRKAEKTISVETHQNAKLVEDTLKESFIGQDTSYPEIESAYFERINNYLEKHKSGCFYQAIDQENSVHASLCLVWDQEMAYYLIGGSMNSFKSTGALSLLLWHAIKESKKMGKLHFNFEGSMIPSIEKYFRGFGGELTPYSNISKKKSKSLKIVKQFKR